MDIVYDRKLYFSYFKMWAYSGAICFVNVEISFTIIAGILLLPLVITSAYGIHKKYTMTYKVGYIGTGKSAIFLNIFLIVLYFIILILVASY